MASTARDPLQASYPPETDAAVVIVGAAFRPGDAEFTAFVAAHQSDLLRTAWLL